MRPRIVAHALATVLCAVISTVALAAPSTPIQRGQLIYERCIGCHAIEANRTGPQHCGLFGRTAGTAPGYDSYSEAMKEANFVWDERTLDWFLINPMQAIPGTTMGYAGIQDAAERSDLIAWLKQATRAQHNCRVAR